MNRTRCFFLLAAIGVLASPQLSGQSVARAPEPITDLRASVLLDRPISLDLKSVRLKQAVDVIAESASVRIQYQGNALDAVARPVSVRATKQPLGRVLSDVLAGTALRFVVSAGDAITIKGVAGDVEVQDGTIVGKVIHAKTKQPVAGATISVSGSDQRVASGDDGSFRIAIAAGEHTVHVRAIGFVRQSRTVIVTDGQAISADFILDPGTSVLDEVVVTGSVIATERKAITTPITVITAADIEKRGITRLEQLFRGEIPGVLAAEVGSSSYNDNELGSMETANLFVRGSSGLNYGNAESSPIKTYVDGVEILNSAFIGTIDPQSIERIEIVTGPQAATLYGSGAMGGVMQIFTKKGSAGSAPEVTLNLRYGILQSNVSTGNTPTHNHSLNMTGGLGGSVSYAASLSHNAQGQWQPGLFMRTWGGSLGITYGNGPLTVSGSAALTTGQNGTTSNSGGLIHRVMAETGQWWQDSWPPGRHLTRRIATSQAQTLALNVNYQPYHWWQHNATLGRNQTNFQMRPESAKFFIPSDTLRLHNSAFGQRITANYNTTLISPELSGMVATFTAGANGSLGRNSTTRGCTPNANVTAWIPCTSSVLSISISDAEDDSWGGFGSLRLAFFDRLYLNLGIRGERNPNYGDKHKIDWTPTNGLAYTLEYNDFTVKFLGSYGKATRSPAQDRRLERRTQSSQVEWEPYEYVSIRANPNLRPEYSKGPEGGVEIYYGNRASLSVNRYNQKITDLIESVIVDTVIRVHVVTGDTSFNTMTRQWINVGRVRQHGWETTGSLNLGMFALRGTYSWNDSRIEAVAPGTSSYDLGESFYRLPTHTGSVTAEYAHGATNVSLITSIIGASRRSAYESWYNQERSNSRLEMYINQRSSWASSGEGTMPGYVKSNLVVSHRINRSVATTLNIRNLGNSFRGENEILMAVLGRQTSVGVSLRFP